MVAALVVLLTAGCSSDAADAAHEDHVAASPSTTGVGARVLEGSHGSHSGEVGTAVVEGVVQRPDGIWESYITLADNDVVVELSAFAPDVQPTDENRRRAAAFIEEVASALAAYRDPQLAFDDGYENWDLFHWANLDYMVDDTSLDPARPEQLLYDPDTMELIGAMFIMPLGQDGPQVAGPLTVWHSHLHEERCYQGTLPIPRDDPACDPSTLTQRSPQMMHVWFIDHPQGPFGTDMVPRRSATPMSIP